MEFTKMHGLGNDYVYVNLIDQQIDNLPELSKFVSDRHFGIGADGIITISSSDKADFFMQIYNADGSKGEMCGNGIRCVGKYVYDNGLTNKTSISVDTLAGIKYLDLNIIDNKVSSVIVDMGEAMCHDGNTVDKDKVIHKLNVLGNEFEVMDISMGNPHTVIFVPEITDDLVLSNGPKIEKNDFYPNRTNVEFIKVIDSNTIEMRVWERGSGETMACGTGACASAVAYMLKNNIRGTITVKLLGGDLVITWKEDNHVLMEGPATKVFDGVLDLQDIIK
ncbi:MAG: diaminopimelate epimerase [Bacilli bacterium]|nr:diaminopimelate epimerase [Bacilli bacterium]